VLGAPISQRLDLFELTGTGQTGLAVMVAVSMSTALASRLVDRSFFLTQLERRAVHLAAGPQAYLPGKPSRVGTVNALCCRPALPPRKACWDMIEGAHGST